jgi:hypothetical protein
VVAAFDAGAIMSDAGAPVLSATDRAIARSRPRKPDRMRLDPPVHANEYRDGFRNTCHVIPHQWAA